ATGTGSRITKRYSAPGTYTVTLTVIDNQGASSSTSQQVTVRRPNQPPVASFTFTPASPNPGDTVTFDASASFDPDGTIVLYTWDFGDTGTGFGKITTHAYTAAGNYTVRLTVRDNLGSIATAERLITVQP
ncbi:MAG: PKD domain-containing protein, partial [Acidobacteria bacterium]|nr:PKD domain-containing protein [Acidobacteriota bacterium]MDW7985542.1 PKD domain-containing protein [Acidobacteriota bacterium]